MSWVEDPGERRLGRALDDAGALGQSVGWMHDQARAFGEARKHLSLLSRLTADLHRREVRTAAVHLVGRPLVADRKSVLVGTFSTEGFSHSTMRTSTR